MRGLGCARRLGRVRAARRPGAAVVRAPRPPRGAGVHVRRGRARRDRLHGESDGLHGRAGVELMVPAGGCARSLGCGRRPRGDAGGASARATRCGSRFATRCMATTSGRRRTRSRPGSAGSARSTRSSPALKSCGGSRRPVRRKLAAFVMEEPRPAPGDADRGGRRGHLRHALADVRPRDRHGLRGRGARPARNGLTIDVRGKPRRARVVKKPIYKREESPSGGD